MKYKCDMIRDLMPLCADNAAADASKNAVVEHIAECKECESYYSKVINEIPVNSEYPDGRNGYVEIAKKIRRRKVLTRTIITLVISTVFLLLLNFAAGFRFTSESAASLSGRLNASSKLIGKYNWGNIRFYIYDSACSYDVVTVEKYLNGWKAVESYLVWPKYASDKGGIINAGATYFWTDLHKKYGIQLFPIIIEDPTVASVEISVFNKTKTVDAELNKLTILTFENQDVHLSNDAAGYAYDSAGNVLYQLAVSEESNRWLWQKVTE